MDVTNNGAFSYSYPIALPAFRDLEPKLELNYNSSRKTRTGGDYQGYLGYQWGLSGVPVIERAGYQLGVPQYVAEDVYLLNGEPLAKCGAGTASPGTSCKAGGNWVSEVENHLKIHFDGTAWMVTGRDGTVTTFTAVGQLPGAPAGPHPNAALNYRFLATSVVDVNGNRVDYSYDCVDLPVCYPKVISYNERAVEFFYDVRPDYLLDLASGAVAATFPGFNWTHLAGDAQAALRALSSVTNVKVISSPNLMVSYNQQAKLQVGDQVPTITQTSTSTTSLPPISFVGSSFRMRLFRSP
ncbi:SpvB/TcaC N-terminal domain-containing protein [Sinorhizobium terangae]|uniref:SpvB/TcaC N-terminal domain-containing protein n=1 Tax=Sinorhizobium terangae TaxID=110322 RepID=UPI0024B1A1CB|nr:SpvB/TcaC N-terminal domain-containing protein [Sinorhizobium terangae]WFU50221.1 SpvB/TcaC N-terminal domain-containing protein [Sinorhizobium terangae]